MNGSIRKRNSGVSVNNMARSSNGWQDADMVFFYGHTTQMQPQWDIDGFKVWRKYESEPAPYWCEKSVSDWTDWGTSAEPYRYHRADPVNNASLSTAYSVLYAYNALTSILIGHDYREGTWYTENVKDSTGTARSGKLGPETEWVVAHGCNAATVAKYFSTGESCSSGATCEDEEGCWNGKCHNTTNTPLGVNAWDGAWDRLHLVLGHYIGTYTSMLPDLGLFASDLKSGDVVKDAYFDMHTCSATRDDEDEGPAYCQPSAISQSPSSCCYWIGYILYCPFGGCSGDYMHSDTWNSPMNDITSNRYYTISWRQNVY